MVWLPKPTKGKPRKDRKVRTIHCIEQGQTNSFANLVVEFAEWWDIVDIVVIERIVVRTRQAKFLKPCMGCHRTDIVIENTPVELFNLAKIVVKRKLLQALVDENLFLLFQ